MKKMNNSTGYYAANPQTKYAVLGCGLALLAFALFMGTIFTLGLGG